MTEHRFRFNGRGKLPPNQHRWQSLQPLPLHSADNPEHYYIAEPGLIAAVNTALDLGMPLLVTGKPGVGKTQLAYRIAYELGCGSPLVFFVKSTTESQDLFYFIDHLRRWHAAQGLTQPDPNQLDTERFKNPIDVRRFITFRGLGLAILRAMPEVILADHNLTELAWSGIPADQRQRQPSVVLIDEIDKAPNDFPNDLLEAVRRLEFEVPEISAQPLSVYGHPGQDQAAERHYRPFILITSNSEKILPEPFLRRCVFYHIEPPSADALENILARRISDYQNLAPGVKQAALEFYLYLRDHARLDKAPSTAELLNWFEMLCQQDPALTEADLNTPPEISETSATTWARLAAFCLLKQQSDQARLSELVELWLERRADRL